MNTKTKTSDSVVITIEQLVTKTFSEIDWKNKEEYLEFVRGWKALYRELSHLIREIKLTSRAIPSLSVGKTRFNQYSLEDLNKRSKSAWEQFRVLRTTLITMQKSRGVGLYLWNPADIATYLLVIRKEQKLLSREAWEKAFAERKSLTSAA